ncbi:activating signal cointegrator 1 complex subunit 2 homolog [Macrobrachium nipponense]|uniref:activating signal cointegrator 1 complex subunit 2 homolog n=1 Tax=Macrobrachium nipponense TaxID=159736 RepID=UPI0030C7D09F
MKGQNLQTTTRTLQQQCYQHTPQHKLPPQHTSHPQYLPQQNPTPQQQHPQQTSHHQHPPENNPSPQQQQHPQQHRDPVQDLRYGQQKPPTNQRRKPPTQQPQQDQQQNTNHRDPRQPQNQATNNTPTPAAKPMSFYSTSIPKTPLLPTPPNHMNTPTTPNFTRDGSTSAESQHNTTEHAPKKGSYLLTKDDFRREVEKIVRAIVHQLFPDLSLTADIRKEILSLTS